MANLKFNNAFLLTLFCLYSRYTGKESSCVLFSIPDGHTKAMPTSGSKQKAKQNKMKVYIGVYSQSKPTRQSLSHRAQVLSNLLSYLFVCKSVQTFSRPNSRSLCQPISTSIHSEEKKAVYTVISLYHCLYLLFRNKTVVERLKTIRASLLPV